MEMKKVTLLLLYTIVNFAGRKVINNEIKIQY